jgi:hypothetical protein
LAGRKVAAPPRQLDQAWTAVLAALDLSRPLVVGGRSAGARVACRTALTVGATGCLALAFPLHPPGRPGRTRLDELLGAGVPTLVVQGERDPFGRPEAAHHRELALVPSDHSLKSGVAEVGRAVGEWLGRVLRPLD